MLKSPGVWHLVTGHPIQQIQSSENLRAKDWLGYRLQLPLLILK